MQARSAGEEHSPCSAPPRASGPSSKPGPCCGRELNLRVDALAAPAPLATASCMTRGAGAQRLSDLKDAALNFLGAGSKSSPEAVHYFMDVQQDE